MTRVVVVAVLGSALIVAGAVMLITPGPGLLAIAAGLAVLAREFHWAQRLLTRARDRIARQFGRSDVPDAPGRHGLDRADTTSDDQTHAA